MVTRALLPNQQTHAWLAERPGLPQIQAAQGGASWGQTMEQRGFVPSPTPQGGAYVPGLHLSRTFSGCGVGGPEL